MHHWRARGVSNINVDADYDKTQLQRTGIKTKKNPHTHTRWYGDDRFSGSAGWNKTEKRKKLIPSYAHYNRLVVLLGELCIRLEPVPV